MTNLKEVSVKIYKNQFFEQFNSYRNSNSISSTLANFHHVNVFFEKKISEIKFKFDSISTLFKKMISEVHFNESVNFFSIESIDLNDALKSDVNNH